jgi:hypothetical protein
LGKTQAGAGSVIEVGKYRGVDGDDIARTEADHFGNCPVCGASVDMRDLAQVLAHIHDGEIEVSEGSKWPFREGRVNEQPF